MKSYTIAHGGTVLSHDRDDELWHVTPKWNWRFWIGHRMRRWSERHDYEGDWEYRTYVQHAAAVLKEACE